jgi:hypothetical protein
MRTTIHLVSSADCLEIAPLALTVNRRNYRSTAFAKEAAVVEPASLLALAEELLVEKPRTRSELGTELGKRWPNADSTALAYTATYLLPVVQVPPRGLWRRSGAARVALVRHWLGADLAAGATAERLFVRYLSAFGPASVADFRAWSGLSLRDADVDGTAGLRTFFDERGRTLYDVGDTPLVDAGCEAPVRFLAPFDNAILGHADRSRIVPPEFGGLVPRGDRLMRVFLVDGFVAGNWTLASGTLTVRPFRRLDRQETREVRTEAERLLAFVVPPGTERKLVLGLR